jgi:orotidine-5'-phosphate decarboxylase
LKSFFQKYERITKEKSSNININLDPALPRQRKGHTIPSKFLGDDDRETLLNFSCYIIEQVSDYCCSVKSNTQFFLGAFDLLPILVKRIHKEGMLAILDHKLSDIGSSNESAIFWIRKMGFDAFTFSPFPGNIEATVKAAHQRDLGVIVLTLMSNPEAEELMVQTMISGQPYYAYVGKKVAETHADGCVVGLTGFVEMRLIKNLQAIVGNEVVFLMQGIGPQGGKINGIKYAKNPLISLGREVIYSPNPKVTVKEYLKWLTWQSS